MVSKRARLPSSLSLIIAPAKGIAYEKHGKKRPGRYIMLYGIGNYLSCFRWPQILPCKIRFPASTIPGPKEGSACGC